uniref:Uncharacterized protein orf544 n=1 Tax=Cyanophora paradoxa TaxID=2762 RepID=E9P1G1_CYAPA|nr:hypothetical protein CYPAM_p44 [Cyanophora paradoxa]ADW79213.1 hypothetical protein [Cyanophora paradoxa]
MNNFYNTLTIILQHFLVISIIWPAALIIMLKVQRLSKKLYFPVNLLFIKFKKILIMKINDNKYIYNKKKMNKLNILHTNFFNNSELRLINYLIFSLYKLYLINKQIPLFLVIFSLLSRCLNILVGLVDSFLKKMMDLITYLIIIFLIVYILTNYLHIHDCIDFIFMNMIIRLQFIISGNSIKNYKLTKSSIKFLDKSKSVIISHNQKVSTHKFKLSKHFFHSTPLILFPPRLTTSSSSKISSLVSKQPVAIHFRNGDKNLIELQKKQLKVILSLKNPGNLVIEKGGLVSFQHIEENISIKTLFKSNQCLFNKLNIQDDTQLIKFLQTFLSHLEHIDPQDYKKMVLLGVSSMYDSNFYDLLLKDRKNLLLTFLILKKHANSNLDPLLKLLKDAERANPLAKKLMVFAKEGWLKLKFLNSEKTLCSNFQDTILLSQIYNQAQPILKKYNIQNFDQFKDILRSVFSICTKNNIGLDDFIKYGKSIFILNKSIGLSIEAIVQDSTGLDTLTNTVYSHKLICPTFKPEIMFQYINMINSTKPKNSTNEK